MSGAEYLSPDILDENFTKCFRPIHKAQMLLGCARIDIRDGFVTPPSKAQKLTTLIWIGVTVITMYLLLSLYYKIYLSKSLILYLTFTLGLALQYLAYLVNIIQSRFYNGEQNVNLYLMLQKVDHHFKKLKDFKIVHRNQFLFNLFAVLYVLLVYGSGFTYYIVNTNAVSKITLLLSGAFVTIHVELQLTIALIYFLDVRLRLLNNIIKVGLNTGNNILGLVNIPAFFNENCTVPHEGESESLTRIGDVKACLKNILKGYLYITKLFEFQVFILVSAAFCYMLVSIEAVVIGLRTQIVPIPVMIVIGLWLSLYTLQLILLVMVNHWFAMNVNATKAMCVRVLSLIYEGPVYETAKSMVRLIEMDQPVFNVYGIFELNKRLPLALLGVLTSNVVILLQFTL